jgi:hypothetical protein
MSKKSKLVLAAAVMALGLSSQAFAQSFDSSHGTSHELLSHYGSNDGRSAEHDVLAALSVTTDPTHAGSCSDKIAGLRREALLNHQATPETVWKVRTYAELMFAADLALTEALEAEGSEGECVLAARRAEEGLPGAARIGAAQ